MASNENSRPSRPSGDRKGDAARAERLRAALRANLRRRKAQAKQRASRPANAGAAHDSAGFVPDKSTD